MQTESNKDNEKVTIQLLFTNDKFSIVSWLVRILTCSRWSHVALVYKYNSLIIDADCPKGVRLRQFHTAISECSDWLILSHEVTKEQARFIREFCCKKVGSKYDYRAIFGYLLQGNDWQNDNRSL